MIPDEMAMEPISPWDLGMLADALERGVRQAREALLVEGLDRDRSLAQFSTMLSLKRGSRR